MSTETIELIASAGRAHPLTRARDWRKLVLAAALYGFGMSMSGGIFINFLVNEMKVSPSRFGVMEAIRETAGFLTAFSGAVTMKVAEPFVACACLLLMAIGVAGYFRVRNFEHVIACSFTWSVGFHLFVPLQQSMNLSLAKSGEEGRRLGLLTSASNFATLGALAFVFTIGRAFTFRQLFLLAAVSLVAGALVVSTISRDIGHPEKPRLVFKPREYGLYYWLAFLEGCRKQFFITFAPLVLTRAFQFTRERMAFLMFINAALSLLLAPQFGRLIDRVGERRVLTCNYVAILLAFVGYAKISNPSLLSALYCVDSVLFFFAVALTTYMKKIAISEDVMPTLAMGMTVNHIAAVIVPLLGGFLWDRFDYPILFYLGTIFVATSLASVQKLPRVSGAIVERPAQASVV